MTAHSLRLFGVESGDPEFLIEHLIASVCGRSGCTYLKERPYRYTDANVVLRGAGASISSNSQESTASSSW
jgi:hypothetical protein